MIHEKCQAKMFESINSFF